MGEPDIMFHFFLAEKVELAIFGEIPRPYQNVVVGFRENVLFRSHCFLENNKVSFKK